MLHDNWEGTALNKGFRSSFWEHWTVPPGSSSDSITFAASACMWHKIWFYMGFIHQGLKVLHTSQDVYCFMIVFNSVFYCFTYMSVFVSNDKIKIFSVLRNVLIHHSCVGWRTYPMHLSRIRVPHKSVLCNLLSVRQSKRRVIVITSTCGRANQRITDLCAFRTS